MVCLFCLKEKHMKNMIKAIPGYLLILAAGLGIGYAVPRVTTWLTPAYETGNYRAYFPNEQTKVVMYGTSWCGYCAKTRAYLAERKIPFVELDIEKNTLAAKQHLELGGGGVPKILIGDRKIQGFMPEVIDAALKQRL